MARKMCKASDLARREFSTKPTSARDLSGRERKEYLELVRMYAAGELQHHSYIYLYQWAKENLGITVSSRAFVDNLKRDALNRDDGKEARSGRSLAKR